MKIGLIYGSDTGNTEYVAELLQKEWGDDVIETHNIFKMEMAIFEQYDILILGIPTWYDGEIQSDWEDAMEEMDDLDFSRQTVALYGLGDQGSWGEYFVDAMGALAENILNLGGSLIGKWPVKDYSFIESKAICDEGYFYGLVIDEDNQPEMTEERIKTWVAQLKQELKLKLKACA